MLVEQGFEVLNFIVQVVFRVVLECLEVGFLAFITQEVYAMDDKTNYIEQTEPEYKARRRSI
jgi:hypothetical protein